ncbi:MAG: pyridoxal phosphate-dependent aminotransferase [Nitrospinota bacterium]
MKAKAGLSEPSAPKIKLSERIASLRPSPTLAVTAKARELRERGVDVIGFGAGEPDFDTPEPIIRAAHKALEEGFTRYTAVSGIRELKEAIARKLLRDNDSPYRPDEIIVTVGAKQAYYSVCQVLLDPGAEVIIPSPYWVSYVDIVELAGGKPVICPLREEDGFNLDPDAVEACVTPATRAVLLNSPCNPTGAVYSREAVEAVVRLAVRKGLFLITDEIYEKIIYDGAVNVCPAGLSEEARAHALVINGFSKAYAMTGWRLGFVAGPRSVIDALETFQSQGTTNPTSFVQKAAVVAMDSPASVLEPMVREFERRRDVIVAGLNAIEGVRCTTPRGAFYAFPRVDGLFGREGPAGQVASSEDLCRYLLEEGEIATVPGSAFGAEGHLRLSYATSMENIQKGIDRMAQAVARLR